MLTIHYCLAVNVCSTAQHPRHVSFCWLHKACRCIKIGSDQLQVDMRMASGIGDACNLETFGQPYIVCIIILRSLQGEGADDHHRSQA